MHVRANCKLFPGNCNEYPTVVECAGSNGGALDPYINVFLLLTQQHYVTLTDKLIAYHLLLRKRVLPAPLKMVSVMLAYIFLYNATSISSI